MKILLKEEKNPLKDNNFHRGVIISVLAALILLFPISHMAEVVVVDPLTSGAIIEQTVQLESAYKKRANLRQQIIAAQTAISGGLAIIHTIENKTLDYMKNASGALQNMNQLKNIGLYSVEIEEQLVGLAKDIPDNPKGAAITAICHKQAAKTYSDIAGLVSVVNSLVKSTYSFSNESGDDGKKHVNLLNSAERYQILMDVEHQMKQIIHNIKLIRYFVRSLDWMDLWKGLDRKSYIKAISIDMDIKFLLNKWNKLTN